MKKSRYAKLFLMFMLMFLISNAELKLAAEDVHEPMASVM